MAELQIGSFYRIGKLCDSDGPHNIGWEGDIGRLVAIETPESDEDANFMCGHICALSDDEGRGYFVRVDGLFRPDELELVTQPEWWPPDRPAEDFGPDAPIPWEPAHHWDGKQQAFVPSPMVDINRERLRRRPQDR
jgi:hypothetical protein